MGDEMADIENIGEQFRFLLQPVRDLAKNWDIDIKHYLEDYLNKLAQEHDNELDARGKRKIFNFAEAAVVIDGSTNIYCRKVDYLLQQTQDCLTEISVSNEKKKKKKATAEGEGGENAVPDDAEDGDGAEDEEMEDPDEARRRKNPYLKPIGPEAEEQMRAQLHKLSKKRPCFPVVPLAFTPLMEYEKTDVLLYHRGGEKKGLEMIGKKDDFRVNTCQIVDGVALIDLKNAELFDMFSRTLHTPTTTRTSTSSAVSIVLDEAESQLAGSLVSERVSTNVFGNHFDDNSENVDPNSGDDFFDFSNEDLVVEYKDVTDDMSIQPKGDLLNSQLAAMLGDGPMVNDDQRMPAFFAADSARPSVNGFSQNSLHEAAAAASAQNDVGLRTQSSVGFTGISSSLEYDANSAPCDLRQSEVNGGGRDNVTLVEEQSEPLYNTERKTRKQRAAVLEEPFEPLDPMELRNSKSRPFQLCKRCVTDAVKQIRQRDRRIEKECRERNVPNVSTVKNFIDTRIFGQKIRKKSHVFASFNSFLVDRALLAVNAEFHAEQQRRAAIQKRRDEAMRLERRLARQTSQRISIDATTHKDSVARLSTFQGGRVVSPPPAYEDPIDELAADEVVDYACEPLDLADMHGDDRPLGDLLDVEDLGEQSFIADVDDDWDRNHGGRRRSVLIRNDNNIFDDTIYAGPSIDYPDELPPRPLSQMEYNELVEYHLKKYWTIKEEATTKFSERVRDWENKVNPLLDKELDHDAFNTRIYSTRLIDSFVDGVGSEIDFTEFAKTAIGTTGDNYNLSRYLLVSLILTNMQNVEIVSADVNRLKLRLTKLERHDEVFDDEQRLITGGE